MSLTLINESARVIAETNKKNERLQSEDAQILHEMNELAKGIEAYRQTYEKYRHLLNHERHNLSEMNRKVYGTNR